MVTGSSLTDVEAFLERRVSDTTLRARRYGWIAAGVFDRLCAEAPSQPAASAIVTSPLNTAKTILALSSTDFVG